MNIEFKLRYSTTKIKNEWKKIQNLCERNIADFKWNYVQYRINGIIYNENTEEFEELFNKIKMWDKLNNKC